MVGLRQKGPSNRAALLVWDPSLSLGMTPRERGVTCDDR
jgi:hypothetical protein